MEQGQSYRKLVLRMITPVFIKWGISVLISTIGTTMLTWFYMIKQGKNGDVDALMELVNNPEKYVDMVEVITEQALSLAVLFEGLAAIVTIPVLVFLMRRDRKEEKLHGIVFEKKKTAIWKYSAVVIISAAMCLGLNNLIFLGNLSSYSATYEETMEILYQPPFIVQILCLAILVPVCEELVFRGLLFRRMRVRVKFAFAAVYSSLIFSIFHGNLVQGLYGFAMGMVFCYLYEKYGTVVAPILAHITTNLVALIGTQYKWFDWMAKEGMRIGTVTVICAAVASTMYVLMQRMESAFPVVPMPSGNHEERR